MEERALWTELELCWHPTCSSDSGAQEGVV